MNRHLSPTAFHKKNAQKTTMSSLTSYYSMTYFWKISSLYGNFITVYLHLSQRAKSIKKIFFHETGRDQESIITTNITYEMQKRSIWLKLNKYTSYNYTIVAFGPVKVYEAKMKIYQIFMHINTMRSWLNNRLKWDTINTEQEKRQWGKNMKDTEKKVREFKMTGERHVGR